MFFLFVVSFTDRGLGLEARCNMNQKTLQYNNLTNKVLGDGKIAEWSEKKL